MQWLNKEKIQEALVYWSKYVHHVEEYANPIIQNDKFYLWSGSSKPEQHHYGKGGLAQHTYEVIQNCRIIADQYNLTDTEKTNLFLAALWHDYGKILDYQPQYEYMTDIINGKWFTNLINTDYSVWNKTEHTYMIHHISRSVIEFNRHCNDYPYKDEVIHCILSHHGQREWGSPVKPRTKIAWCLHLCDGLSARITDCGGIHVN